MKYYAHIRRNENGEIIARQTVEDHCRGAARYASKCLKPVGLGNTAYLAALCHDAGKFKKAFQDYLLNGTAPRGSVIHTFSGCRMLLEYFHRERVENYSDLSAELISYAVGAHHGLFDCVDVNRDSGFLQRMEKEGAEHGESLKNFFGLCANPEEIRELFSKADEEFGEVYEKLSGMLAEDGTEIDFYLGLLARLILSAVIEGDRRDTAEFMSDRKAQPGYDLKKLWHERLSHMEEKLCAFTADRPINEARSEISERCRSAAECSPGVFRLNVPTGSGKTLAGLRFALAHAAHWNKKRIIFTVPLLTILEQNADVIRKYLGDDSIILECHSNVIRCAETPEQLDRLELAEESFDAPVIITTLVQLLNILFQGKTGSIRRFHSLCDSVILIDEVQTVPPKMLSLFNLAVNFLAEICGATILLCSATQPALEKTEHSLLPKGKELVEYNAKLWTPFRRTEISALGEMSLEDIAAFALDKAEKSSVLVVCNKKKEASYLFERLCGQSTDCFHLSASMCPAHRRDTLAAIGEGLEEKKNIICVSTQVIEAGVDVSFGCVIRLTAGMDSVVQSAGRCNRHGENEGLSPVYIINCKGEKLTGLRDIEDGKKACLHLLELFRQDPESFDFDLSSDKSIECYYRGLYRNHAAGYHDYPVRQHGSIYRLLSDNSRYFNGESKYAERFAMKQAFRLAGELFSVFDENSMTVVVPYGDGKRLINELLSMGDTPDIERLREWAIQAKPYAISIPVDVEKQMFGMITVRHGMAVLLSGCYDADRGFTGEPAVNSFLEVASEKYQTP